MAAPMISPYKPISLACRSKGASLLGSCSSELGGDDNEEDEVEDKDDDDLVGLAMESHRKLSLVPAFGQRMRWNIESVFRTVFFSDFFSFFKEEFCGMFAWSFDSI